MRLVPLILLLATLLVSACETESAPSRQNDDDGATVTSTEPSIPFRKDGTLEFLRNGAPFLTIDVEIADNDSSRTRGMMQRESMPDRSGMLFIFPYAAPQQFWMSNTPLSLDLMYIDADSQIVSMSKYAAPFSPDPLESVVPAQYVLEVEAGFVDSHGIIESDRIRWQRN